MITSITIKNFQCHKNLTIKLDKHVTIITGKNDAGKSAIIRSLRWCAFNRPVGKAFIHRGSKSTSVILCCGGKHRIRRSVGSSNVYTLDGKKYKAFRNAVPPAISKLLRLQEINFQRQHQPLFWFDLTPGQTAKELNRLVDLESIDRVQAEVAKQLREKKAGLEVVKKRLQEARDGVRLYRPVKAIAVKLDKLDKLGRYRLKSPTIAALAALIRSALVHAATAQNAATAAATGHATGAIWADGRDGTERTAKLAGMVAGLQRAKLATKQVPRLPDWPQTEGTDRLEELFGQGKELEIKLTLIEETGRKKVQNLEDQLGGRCPWCGSFLTNESLI